LTLLNYFILLYGILADNESNLTAANLMAMQCVKQPSFKQVEDLESRVVGRRDEIVTTGVKWQTVHCRCVCYSVTNDRNMNTRKAVTQYRSPPRLSTNVKCQRLPYPISEFPIVDFHQPQYMTRIFILNVILIYVLHPFELFITIIDVQ